MSEIITKWKTVVKSIEKSLKEDKIFQLSDEGVFAKVEAVSSGLATFDIASGIGGIPRGRIIEIYGQL